MVTDIETNGYGTIEKITTPNGLHKFSVKAPNGQIIVDSEPYASRSARDNGIASLKKVISSFNQ